MSRNLGRFRMTDVAHAMDDGGNATKTKIATFAGDHFVAEREGSELHIYAVGDVDGMPGATVLGNTGDAALTIRDINRMNAGRRGERAS